MFPPTVTSKKLFNTCVRPHAGDDSAVTFVMAYEFNEPGAGWQTGFAVTHDADLREARWTCVPRPSPESMASASASDSVAKYAELSHANPTLRFGNDGWWYLLSTRGTNKTLVEEVWRSRDVTSFVWEAPASWSRQDATVAAFLVPSHADQTPLRNGWHPDTHSVVKGNATELDQAKNDNVSDLDLCTVTLPTGEVATVMYYAWGDQELGPTAMVLAMAIVKGSTQEEVLASHCGG